MRRFISISISIFVAAVVACGGASEGERGPAPPPPPSEGGEETEQRVGDGRIYVALPEDGSLEELEAILIRHRDEDTPIERIVIHTARTAPGEATQEYLDAIRALVRRLGVEPDIHVGGPADAPHLMIVTHHRPPIGR